jgi:uncharacterized protein YfaA (DUF2138 family)
VGERPPDIVKPDALIRSYSLSKLPADLLRIPLAKDVLTEDFVAYYEENKDRMAISGALRRIAFEHKQDLSDKLLDAALDEPAEVALWRDEAGRLQDFAVVLRLNALARALRTILPAIAKASDLQLSTAGKLDDSDVDILVLEYRPEHRLLLLAKGERVVVLSNPAMLLLPNPDKKENWPQSEDAVTFIKALLDNGETVSPFARHFLIDQPLPEKNHSLTLGTPSFALGYESFIPGLAALDLTFDNTGKWQSQVLLNSEAAQNNGIWNALPYGASLCAALPVDWAQMEGLLKTFDSHERNQQDPAALLAANFSGAAAICWYQNSRLYTPLFAARLKSNANAEQVQTFFSLFDRMVNGNHQEDADAADTLRAHKIASRFGSPGQGTTERSLNPAIAIKGDAVFFSPDVMLVESALKVAAKNYPALSDGFNGSRESTLLFIAPDALANLLKKEVFAALPVDQESVFRDAAEVYLSPRFYALARYPAQRVKLAPIKQTRLNQEDDTRVWWPLVWEATKTAN